VLTLVESILENPEPILMKQLDKIKTEKLAELKAQGVEYDERIAELEKLEYPKPHRDFLYATYNDFAKKHPWLGQENIRPKSVAREMYEQFYTFDEYVREYGLQRSEGLVLRYISDVYKALSQTVPDRFKDEGVLDIEAYFRTMVREVDSSLLDEWEKLQGFAPRPERAQSAGGAPRSGEAGGDAGGFDKRAFVARVRSEMHRLLKALAAKNYEEAARCVAPGRSGEWTPAQIEGAMADYWAEYDAIMLDQEARSVKHTQVEQMDEQEWNVSQTVVDPQGENGWSIDCTVDLSQPRDPALPWIALRRIGG
jgi:Domain of unknown function (DUF3516)